MPTKYNSPNYPGEILHIVNNEFQVNTMNNSEKLQRWPQKKSKIFYTSNIIVKQIESPQVDGSCDHFEFNQI